MPFDNAGLNPLLSASGFTFWLYRTTDTRAQTLVAGYFAPAAARLETGDLILVQAADSVAFQPVRAGDVVAAGLVIDTAPAPFRVSRAAAQRFSVRQAVSAVAMTVVLMPLAAGIVANGSLRAEAAVAGPVAEVRFSIRDAAGSTVRGPTAAAVTAGTASVTFAAPAAGSGYRLRVEATGRPEVSDTSPPFAVTAPFALLLQSLGTLLLQDGGRVLV
ncbi:hypothetical protein [Falsiroseomonas sp. CW058]|uniref:hypothetical protein n=1 Tax=Falsiroseomonas sp. CW058 TaxID=3388664 RepID=UPI003D31B36A